MEYPQPDNILCARCLEPMVTHVTDERGREMFTNCPLCGGYDIAVGDNPCGWPADESEV